MIFVRYTDTEISARLSMYLFSLPRVLAQQVDAQVQEKLAGYDAALFKFVFSVSSQTGMFAKPGGHQYFVSLMESDLHGLSNIMRLFLDYPVFKEIDLQDVQQIFTLLPTHNDLESLNQAIRHIAKNRHRLFETSFASMILKVLTQHANPNGVAATLTFLADYDMLDEDNINSIAKYSRPMLLKKELSQLYNLPVERQFFQEIFSLAIERNSLLDFCEKIQFLHENKQLDMHSIRSVDEVCNIIKDLASFREKALSQLSFFPTRSSSTSPVSPAAASSSIELSTTSSLSDLLTLCQPGAH